MYTVKRYQSRMPPSDNHLCSFLHISSNSWPNDSIILRSYIKYASFILIKRIEFQQYFNLQQQRKWLRTSNGL